MVNWSFTLYCCCLPLFRWKSKEPHDVVIDCEKVSLDPNDCRLQESEVLSLVSPSGQSFSEVNTSESSGILTSSENSVQQTAHDEDRLDTATQTGTSLQNLYSQRTRNSFDSGTDMPNNTPLVASSAMFCSPTTLCSLATPPPSQDTSPTGSTHDISCGNAYSNPSPAYSSANINNIELSNLKAPPTIREHSAGRLNSNSKQPLPHSCVAASGAVEDSIVCGRSTPPISSNGKDGERHKEICLGITEDKKQKDALGIDFGENIISEKESSEIASESGEKDSKSKPSLILFLNKTLEMLVPFTSAVCRRCMEEKPRSSSKGKTDWENELSPSQLLDHYLNFGKSLQEKRLNRYCTTANFFAISLCSFVDY